MFDGLLRPPSILVRQSSIFVFLLPLLLLLALPAVVQAEDYSYTTNAGAITITRYTGPGGDVTIPSTINGLPVASIGWPGFVGQSSLTNVTIPNSVTNIGYGAFSYCTSLEAITVDPNNPAYSSVDGVLFNTNQTVLIQCPGGKAGNYTVPNSVTNIGGEAFASCFGLANVTIGNSVTSIEEGAFYQCFSLTNISIPNSVTSIGDGVFGSCTSLASVSIPDSVVSIGGGVFASCTSLTNVTIGDGVTSIEESAFYNCTSLTSITIPNSVTNIGNSAFFVCTSLTTITIPNSVTSIGDGAFSACTSLTAITVDSNNPVYSSVDGVLFAKNQTVLIRYPAGKVGSQYTIPNSVTNIGGEAFDSCTSLTNVTIGESVTTIEWYAFFWCANLTSVTIPDSVTNIGEGAFGECTNLREVLIGNSVTSIADATFVGCTSLTSVTIPNSVASIGNGVFSYCTSLTAITVASNNPVYSSVDGVLFAKNQTVLIQYPLGKTGNQYAIPNSVTNIGLSAFSGCTSLASVTIPNGVTSIEDWAFYNCTGLTGAYFRGNAPSLVGLDAFVYADNAVVYYLPGTTGWIPQVQTADAAFGVRTNQFGFTITGATGLGFVVEACTNLAQPVWLPLQTNTLTSGSVYFSDPQWTNYPARFYHLQGSTFGGRPLASWHLPYPVILSFGPSFGGQTNGFGFIISWATNLPVVVEACTNLANAAWSPVSTNTLTGGSSHFSDPQWKNYPARFYRLRWP